VVKHKNIEWKKYHIIPPQKTPKSTKIFIPKCYNFNMEKKRLILKFSTEKEEIKL